MNPKHFDDDFDLTNDDGYIGDDHYEPTPDDLRELDEWWDEVHPNWMDEEPCMDPEAEENYDPVDESDNSEPSDEWDDEGWDDTPIGLDYDGYNDPEDY